MDNTMTPPTSEADRCISHGQVGLIDRFGRPVDYLRISVTQRCDHQCFFCHREGERFPGEEMTPGEIERIVRVAARQGVRRVKLTGGEALVRDDIVEIVRRIAPLVEDLSLTTNGSRLAVLAQDLADAGLNRVNVSLHTLDRETHLRITGTDDIDEVKRGIERAVQVGLSPVKINMTVLRGYNERDIPAMLRYAASVGAILQLIELQPMPDGPEWIRGLWFGLSEIEEEVRRRALRVTRRRLHGRMQYELLVDGSGTVRVEFVKPLHNNEFCSACTRLRVTSDGRLKPCLLRSDNLVDVGGSLHSMSDEEVLRAIEEAVCRREPYYRGE